MNENLVFVRLVVCTLRISLSDDDDEYIPSDFFPMFTVSSVFRNTAAEKELGQIRDEHEKEIRTLRNKHEASVEFLKQEQQISSAKVSKDE